MRALVPSALLLLIAACSSEPTDGVRDGGDASAGDARLSDAIGSDVAPTDALAADAPSTGDGSTPASTKPGAGNTGVPAGTALQPYTGDCTISTAGTTLENVEATCTLIVAAPDVTVRRSHFGGLFVRETTRTLVEDTTTDHGIAISSSTHVTFRRNDFHGPGDGLHITSDGRAMCDQILLEGNWIHGPEIGPEDHYDVMQVRGVRNLTLRGNTFDAGEWVESANGGTNAVVFFENANGGNDTVVVEGNWLNGGGYMIYTSATNARFVNNRIGRDHHFGLLYTPATPFMEAGNVWEDDGTPVQLQQ